MSPNVSLSLMLSEAVAFYDPIRSDTFKAVNTVAADNPKNLHHTEYK